MTSYSTLQFMLLVGLVSGICCIFLAEKRGGSSFGWFIMGFISGPLGIIIALTAGKKCKSCFSVVPSGAKKCRYCNEQL
ncbi:MAG: hypothetical protein KDC88_14135 [Ignavibacteriae bacterium]|nr:hypothetical protein [Ignavibacteriota bacterium]